jgi:hypothetical protein
MMRMFQSNLRKMTGIDGFMDGRECLNRDSWIHGWPGVVWTGIHGFMDGRE